MKHINKLLIIAMLWVVASCGDSFELDYLQNPNQVSPDQAGLEFVYNKVVLDFNGMFYDIDNFTNDLSRQTAMIGGFTYNSSFQAQGFNGFWNRAYAGLFQDIKNIQALAAESGADVHAGSALIMQSMVMTTLVDMFNDVPFSEALQGTDVISPNQDDGASVYAAADALLDDAIALLTGTSAAAPANDIFYGGDAAKWITLANTLKLRIYNNTRLVDGSAGSKIKAIVDAGDIIDSAAEDFQFQYGTQRLNPNSRHPYYNDWYEAVDGDYMNNYYMWLLVGEKDLSALSENQDPRTRFYFYRQDPDLSNEDPNVWDCIVDATPFDSNGELLPIPPHYAAVDANMPYCLARVDGYFGRDHGNGSGIPPDGNIRTTYGIYPAGGRWDNNTFDITQNNGVDGALGGGITPIMLSSFVYFMRAEAALTASTGEDARELLEAGVRASMDKVLGFESLIGSADLNSVIATDPITGEDIFAGDVLLPSDDDVEAYVAYVLDAYDNAASDTERLDIVMKEYLIASWGNGLEAYNAYRRTAMPLNVQPTIEVGGGDYLLTALYPADHVNLNANVTQREFSDKVFWATGGGHR